MDILKISLSESRVIHSAAHFRKCQHLVQGHFGRDSKRRRCNTSHPPVHSWSTSFSQWRIELTTFLSLCLQANLFLCEKYTTVYSGFLVSVEILGDLCNIILNVIAVFN